MTVTHASIGNKPGGHNPGRKMRADARRNYERLLTEAESVFAEHGTDASLEEIARRAGVAIGTLYGHFPNRQALVEALIAERIQNLVTQGEALLDDPSPGEALVTWMRLNASYSAAFRGLSASLLSCAKDESSPLYGTCQLVMATGEALLGRAQDAGEVRAEVQAGDLFALINAVVWLCEQVSSEQAERLLALGLDGMRAARDS